jgi:hypothetical protein
VNADASGDVEPDRHEATVEAELQEENEREVRRRRLTTTTKSHREITIHRP